MLNVLHVTPSMSPTWGGPTVAVSELASELARQGVNCEIVTTRGYRVGIDQISSPGVPIYSFDTGFPARFWTAYSPELSRFLNENADRFDLIHIHQVWHYPVYAAFRSARKNKLPCVLTIRGELSDWGLRQKALKKRIYRLVLLDRMLQNVSMLHALTRAEKDLVVKLGYETPVVVAPNGIETAPFEALPAPAEFINRFPVLKGKRIILFLGRLHAKKGLDILARSFSTIAKRFEDVVLLVVGPNKFGTQEKMEAILSSEDLLGRTVFTGLLTGEDKLAAFSCADLFVLPSHSEGFANAVLEAMAARLPVVITKGCEFPEVSEHEAGLIVESDEGPITEAISLLLSNAVLCKRMGQQGHKLVTKRYSWQATAAIMVNLYQALVAGGICQE